MAQTSPVTDSIDEATKPCSLSKLGEKVWPTPTTLQLFFPESMPKIEICMALLLSLREKDIILDVLGRAGHPITNNLDLADPELRF
ncbi:hypothetical protein DUT91_22430 [Phyllobacterium salinisoli]|uniref:Uncharacterized protein n=1 Tax=Phyllobacterium salinisoli TaxID=1899321 RepID=A0A368JZP3_9HYPH|nr:hypothetical protein DUT91_22430 [Phyllobacterium salinisoli]